MITIHSLASGAADDLLRVGMLVNIFLDGDLVEARNSTAVFCTWACKLRPNEAPVNAETNAFCDIDPRTHYIEGAKVLATLRRNRKESGCSVDCAL